MRLTTTKYIGIGVGNSVANISIISILVNFHIGALLWSTVSIENFRGIQFLWISRYAGHPQNYNPLETDPQTYGFA